MRLPWKVFQKVVSHSQASSPETSSKNDTLNLFLYQRSLSCELQSHVHVSCTLIYYKGHHHSCFGLCCEPHDKEMLMIVQYMRVNYGHGYTGATHMTKVFAKRTILFLLCARVQKSRCCCNCTHYTLHQSNNVHFSFKNITVGYVMRLLGRALWSKKRKNM